MENVLNCAVVMYRGCSLPAIAGTGSCRYQNVRLNTAAGGTKSTVGCCVGAELGTRVGFGEALGFVVGGAVGIVGLCVGLKGLLGIGVGKTLGRMESAVG